MAYSEGVCQLKKESKSLKDVIHHHMVVITGRSEHTQRSGSVDSSSQQCMKIQDNLFRDVARSKTWPYQFKGCYATHQQSPDRAL